MTEKKKRIKGDWRLKLLKLKCSRCAYFEDNACYLYPVKREISNEYECVCPSFTKKNWQAISKKESNKKRSAENKGIKSPDLQSMEWLLDYWEKKKTVEVARMLAFRYETEGENEANYAQGVKWRLKASRLGDAESHHILERIYEDIEKGNLERELEPVCELLKEYIEKERHERAEAERKQKEEQERKEAEKQKEEFEINLLSAKIGNVSACIKVAQVYSHGICLVEKDLKKAIQWIIRAFELSNEESVVFSLTKMLKVMSCSEKYQELYIERRAELDQIFSAEKSYLEDRARKEKEREIQEARRRAEEEKREIQEARRRAEEEKRAAAEREARRWERERQNRRCQDCRYFIKGLPYDIKYDDLQDEVVKFKNPKEFSCMKLQDNPAVSPYGCCNEWEPKYGKTKKDAGYREIGD